MLKILLKLLKNIYIYTYTCKLSYEESLDSTLTPLRGISFIISLNGAFDQTMPRRRYLYD